MNTIFNLSESTYPDLSFLQGRMSTDNIRLLTQMNRSHANGWSGVTPYHLFSYWFGNDPAPKGFGRVKAPTISEDRLRRIKAMFYYSKNGEGRLQEYAKLYVNTMLWMSIFPEICENIYDFDKVFDFDATTVEDWLKDNMDFGSDGRNAATKVSLSDPVRIAYNQM